MWYSVDVPVGICASLEGSSLVCAGAKGRWVPPSLLSSPNITVTWSSRTVWRPALDFPLVNIWYFSGRVMPLYTVRRMNASGLFDTPLPPMGKGDMLYMAQPAAREKYAGGWHQEVLKIATGGDIPMVTTGDPWAQQWTPSNLVCFKNVVMTGAYAYVVCGCAGVGFCGEGE